MNVISSGTNKQKHSQDSNRTHYSYQVIKTKPHYVEKDTSLVLHLIQLTVVQQLTDLVATNKEE